MAGCPILRAQVSALVGETLQLKKLNGTFEKSIRNKNASQFAHRCIGIHCLEVELVL